MVRGIGGQDLTPAASSAPGRIRTCGPLPRRQQRRRRRLTTQDDESRLQTLGFDPLAGSGWLAAAGVRIGTFGSLLGHGVRSPTGGGRRLGGSK